MTAIYPVSAPCGQSRNFQLAPNNKNTQSAMVILTKENEVYIN
jgi:hypothetical protein